MAISVQNKKNRYVRGGHGPRVVRRTILDGLRPTARSNYVRWFDSTVGRWLSEDPAAADEKLYRYCENAPTDGTDPSGLQPWMPPANQMINGPQGTANAQPANLQLPTPTGPTVPPGAQTQINPIYPYDKKKAKTPYFNIWLSIAKDTNVPPLDELYVSIKPTNAFQNEGKSWGPDRVITGHKPGSVAVYGDEDADSAQWAMRWSDRNGKEVKRETNSYTLAERKANNAAARWYQVTPGDPYSDEYSGSIIPDCAKYVEVLVIYTDVFEETAEMDEEYEKTDPNGRRKSGDMPLIIGAWTGYRGSDGNWTFEKDPRGLVISTYTQLPTLAEKKEMVIKVTNELKTRTGFNLVPRTPIGGNPHDTGFDIEP